MFNLFKRNKERKRKLTEKEVKWNKMWDLWAEGEIESPYNELMTYQSEINNGGHSQYFLNTENTSDVSKDVSVLAGILPTKLKGNLESSYQAYLKLEQDENDEEAESTLEKCDDVFYENEQEVTEILEAYCENLDI